MMANTLTRTDEAIAMLNKHARLERAVVEAAKAWNQATFYTLVEFPERESELSEAVENLDKYEAEMNSEV